MKRRPPSHVDDPKAVGARVREARLRAGLSQQELAADLCSAAYVSRIETGSRTPSLQLLRVLAQRLGVTEDALTSDARTGPGSKEGQTPPNDDPILEAEMALRLDDVEEAERLFTSALEQADNARDRARALAGVGQLAFRRDEFPQAIAALEEALALGISPPSVSAVENLGRAYALVGEPEQAIGVFERALEAAEEREDALEIVRFSVLLANALIDRGNIGRAEELLGATLARTHDSPDPLVRVRLYWSEARLHTARGDPNAAARYARKALETLELSEHDYYTARAHRLLAHIELDRGRAEEALELLGKAEQLGAQAGNVVEKAELELEQARALAQLGRPEEAGALAMEVSGRLSEASVADAGRAYALLGEIFEDIGEPERARELYELAADGLERYPGKYFFTVCSRLSELLAREGRMEDALDVAQRALRVQLHTPLPAGSG